MQSPDKKKILTKEWDLKLSAVKIRKEDMNRLVMNFLVTEVFLQKLPLRNAVHKLVHSVDREKCCCRAMWRQHRHLRRSPEHYQGLTLEP